MPQEQDFDMEKIVDSRSTGWMHVLTNLTKYVRVCFCKLNKFMNYIASLNTNREANYKYWYKRILHIMGRKSIKRNDLNQKDPGTFIFILVVDFESTCELFASTVRGRNISNTVNLNAKL